MNPGFPDILAMPPDMRYNISKRMMRLLTEHTKSPGGHDSGAFLFVLTTTSFTCGGEKAEALIRKNKTSSGIMGKRRQPQTEPEEAEYGREQFITYKVEMSISHSDHTEISQKSDI